MTSQKLTWPPRCGLRAIQLVSLQGSFIREARKAILAQGQWSSGAALTRLTASPHLLIPARMSTTKRQRGGTPRAGPAAAAAASALPSAASTSAVALPPWRTAACSGDVESATGSFHARDTAASAVTGTGGAFKSPSPYNPAKQVTPSPKTRGGQSHQQHMRSDSEDDTSDSTSSEDDDSEADANSAGASANVSAGQNHMNDKEVSNNLNPAYAMDRAVHADLFSSSSSSSSSSENDMLDSDDDDSITKEVMQILEEEVRRGQESDDEMEQNGLESESEAEDNDNTFAGADPAAGRRSSPTFEVERILARRYDRQRKRIEYLLAWRSGADDPAEHSWEPHEHLDYRAKDHVQERWGDSCPNVRASDGIETNDPVLDGPRVAQYRLWETQQLSLHRRRRKSQPKKRKGMPNHRGVANRKALTRNNFAASQLPIEADNAIAPERPLVPLPRPLVAEIETIEIFWKAGIQPFMLETDKWELVDDWSLITVYEWRGEAGSDGGLCCVGCHPHRHFPVRTAWRTASRAGRRGRSRIDRLTPDFEDREKTKFKGIKASTKAALVTQSPSISSPRSEGAKRKRPNINMNFSGEVEPARSSGSSPLNSATSRIRTTKAAASFTANSKFVGSRVCKCFDGVIHFGTVKKYFSSVNARWAIHYDDDDTEDMNKRELERAIELYERKKSEDVGNTSTAEDVDNGWDFGEDAEIDDDLSLLAPQKPIGLPQIALEETIEFLWEKGVFPFLYSANRVEVVDDWNDYQIFHWREGSGGGTAIVSYKSHPKVKVRVKWRPMKGRRRRKTNFLKPAKNFSSSNDGTLKKASRAQAHARRHSHGRAKKSAISMLELFSGSGVLSNSFRRKGVESETLDDDPTWSPSHCLSIAELRKQIEDDTLAERLNQPKDIVFAAPCCTTFSRGSCGRHRNRMNLNGHSPESKAANQMIDDLIFVLKYYKRLNPKCLLVIENPEGYLHKTKYAEIFEKEGDDELCLKRVTVSYCMLSDGDALPRKHTSLWTNSKNLHHVCRNDAYKCCRDCHVRASNGQRHQKHVQDKDDRYASYPEEFNRFVRENLLADVRAEQCEESQLSASFMSASSSSSSSGSEFGE